MKKILCLCSVFLLLLLLAAPALSASSGIVVPSFPLEIAGYDLGYTNKTRFMITGVEYQIKDNYSGRVNLEITIKGKKTFDVDGDTNIRFSQIRVDLYDSKGLRVDSQSISAGGNWVGASLSFCNFTFYSLKPDIYTLKFRDAVNVPAPTPTPTPSPVPSLPGDVNADGTVDGRDLLRLARHLAGHSVQIDPAASDLNGDSSIDGRDLLRLAKRLAGL